MRRARARRAKRQYRLVDVAVVLAATLFRCRSSKDAEPDPHPEQSADVMPISSGCAIVIELTAGRRRGRCWVERQRRLRRLHDEVEQGSGGGQSKLWFKR